MAVVTTVHLTLSTVGSSQDYMTVLGSGAGWRWSGQGALGHLDSLCSSPGLVHRGSGTSF
jgi:hypothetical protein